jgi:hypothetical protein
MHVIAGFESQIAARGGALAISDAAQEHGLTIGGAAVARRATDNAIHVEPLPGFEMPEHVLGALDAVFSGNQQPTHLRMGEAGLVVSLGDDADAVALAAAAQLERLGALWVVSA